MKIPYLVALVTALLISCTPKKSVQTETDWRAWAETPPMGWNSYDAYHGAITEKQFKACVDVLAEEMLPLGWEYAVIDFCWYRPAADAWYKEEWKTFKLAQEKDEEGNYVPELVMDEYARVLPDVKRWPSAANGMGFKEVGDYVHSKGMKFGIHIMRGIPQQAVDAKTPILGTNVTAADIAELNNVCPWMNHMYGVDIRKPGAQEYYNSIFQLYADWGVDYIKADDMMVPPYHKGEIEMMHKAILNTGRPMVLSLSCGEAPLSKAVHLENNANLYRISADFWDDWDDVLRMFELCEVWSPYIGNGTWPDADMIPIGNLRLTGFPGASENPGSHRNGHESYFTEEEHLTLMSLWCMMRSPLMWGGDPLTSSAWSKSFLKNEEVLAVLKNSTNNRQIFERNSTPIWFADIPGSNDKYLALFNISDDPKSVNFDFYWELLNGKYIVRDLWSKKDLGIFEKQFMADLRAHEGRIYKLSVAQ